MKNWNLVHEYPERYREGPALVRAMRARDPEIQSSSRECLRRNLGSRGWHETSQWAATHHRIHALYEQGTPPESPEDVFGDIPGFVSAERMPDDNPEFGPEVVVLFVASWAREEGEAA